MKRMTLQIKAPSKCKDAEAPQGYIKKYTGRHQISDPSLSSRQSASGKAVFTSQSQIVQTAELQPAGISRRRRAHTVAAPSAISIVHTHTHAALKHPVAISHLLQTGAHTAFISPYPILSATILHTH